LRKDSSGFTGTNTDLFAIRAILLKYMNSQAALKITILGDGSMSRLTARILAQIGIPFVVHSRKTRSDFHEMDLGHEGPGLVINTCSRDFIFQGTLGPETIFWDFNYNFPPHRQFLPSRCKSYRDGQEMLELQARENLRFWDLLHR
jgi:shikimate 5-dehydrogenase